MDHFGASSLFLSLGEVWHPVYKGKTLVGHVSERDKSSRAQLAYVLSTFYQTSQWDPEILLRYYYHSNKALFETSKADIRIYKNTHTITAQRQPLPTEYSFLFNGNLGRRAAPAQHLTATSVRKMFLIWLCHLIIHILPRLCRTILQDINSQLNPGLYHLWGQSSRSPRRSGDFPPHRRSNLSLTGRSHTPAQPHTDKHTTNRQVGWTVEK